MQHRRHDFHVDRPRAADFDVAAGDRADHRPTARPRCNRRTASWSRALRLGQPFDADRVRAFAGDADAHAAQELAQLDDVRLAGGVADLGDAGRRRRGQQRRFGAGHRRLVEIDRRRLQAVRRFEPVAGARQLHARPSRSALRDAS